MRGIVRAIILCVVIVSFVQPTNVRASDDAACLSAKVAQVNAQDVAGTEIVTGSVTTGPYRAHERFLLDELMLAITIIDHGGPLAFERHQSDIRRELDLLAELYRTDDALVQKILGFKKIFNDLGWLTSFGEMFNEVDPIMGLTEIGNALGDIAILMPWTTDMRLATLLEEYYYREGSGTYGAYDRTETPAKIRTGKAKKRKLIQQRHVMQMHGTPGVTYGDDPHAAFVIVQQQAMRCYAALMNAFADADRARAWIERFDEREVYGRCVGFSESESEMASSRFDRRAFSRKGEALYTQTFVGTDQMRDALIGAFTGDPRQKDLVAHYMQLCDAEIEDCIRWRVDPDDFRWGDMFATMFDVMRNDRRFLVSLVHAYGRDWIDAAAQRNAYGADMAFVRETYPRILAGEDLPIWQVRYVNAFFIHAAFPEHIQPSYGSFVKRSFSYYYNLFSMLCDFLMLDKTEPEIPVNEQAIVTVADPVAALAARPWASKGKCYPVNVVSAAAQPVGITTHWELFYFSLERIISNGYHAVEKVADTIPDQDERITITCRETTVDPSRPVEFVVVNPGAIDEKYFIVGDETGLARLFVPWYEEKGGSGMRLASLAIMKLGGTITAENIVRDGKAFARFTIRMPRVYTRLGYTNAADTLNAGAREVLYAA